MDRETRNLGHEKQSRIKSINRPPESSDGKDGDIQIYNGRLYIKDNNMWYSYSSDADKLSNIAAFVVEMNGNQTSIGTTLTTVEFDTMLIDVRSGFNTSTYKYHVQDGYGGYYFIGSDLVVDHSDADGEGVIELSQSYADGTLADVWQGFFQSEDSGEYITMNKNAIFNASSGDTFEVKVKAKANTLDINYEDKTIFYGFKIS